ncbi:MCE family protein [Nocardioides sp. JQ2195]|uniref:MlaD family protein n=1 Tax=Nocardioides sp. JQ2195 TaxID=2592334 RepID=UPI00143E844C|nr:MlaD family protein [Nocardioides sp. JQ2195]QIX26606.1 MCE family protein [Nocardioides sp. JQ2195]
MKLIAIKFGVFGLVAILLFVALHNTMTNKVDGETKTLHAIFSNVSGLRTGDDVRISGVKVGRVEGVETVQDPGRAGAHLAKVTFSVDDTQKVSDTTKVVMRYQNLLGQKYLALTPGSKPGELLADGDEIDLANTRPGFDLTALLNGFEPLFNVLSPKDLNTLAANIVSVLNGEAGSVERLLGETAELTSFLADKDEVFGEVVDNLTPVIDNLASNSDEFDTALVELRKLVTELNKGSGDFFGALDTIGTNLDSTTELVNDLRPTLERDIRSLRRLGATIARGTPVIERSFDSLPKLVGAFVRSLSYGSHLSVYNCSLGFKLFGADTTWLGNKDKPHSEACR